MSYSTYLVLLFYMNFLLLGTGPKVSWPYDVILVLKSCFVSLQRPTYWLA